MIKRRVLITCADRYMGPAIQKKFQNLHFEVIAAPSPMISEDQITNVIDAAGHIDFLVANFAYPPVTGELEQLRNDDWMMVLNSLVAQFLYLIYI